MSNWSGPPGAYSGPNATRPMISCPSVNRSASGCAKEASDAAAQEPISRRAPDARPRTDRLREPARGRDRTGLSQGPARTARSRRFAERVLRSLAARRAVDAGAFHGRDEAPGRLSKLETTMTATQTDPVEALLQKGLRNYW